MEIEAFAFLDWFIPDATSIERSERGLARNFVLTHLLGPFLVQSIAVLLYRTDRQAGLACWTMMACISAFWLLPFALRITSNFRVVALISVELLCVTSLVGTSFYGGVNSPFLPWLLVSLMLGFFYLSDDAVRVLALFACNIIVMLVANTVFHIPQHLNAAELVTISWFSVFSATAYMSWMAIYYANIISMSSELERETERLRSTAQQLREATQRADMASHGKSVFLAKMSRQIKTPLQTILASSQSLLDRLSLGADPSGWTPEVRKIDRAGHRLLSMVSEFVDSTRVEADALEPETEDFALLDFVYQTAAPMRSILAQNEHDLIIEAGRDLGRALTDAGKLRDVILTLTGRVAAATRSSKVCLTVRRDRKRGGDWIEIQLRAIGRSGASGRLYTERRVGEPFKDAPAEPIKGDDLIETSRMRCAILGGSLLSMRNHHGVPSFIIRVPVFSIERISGDERQTGGRPLAMPVPVEHKHVSA